MTDILAIADGLWPFLLGAVLAWIASSVVSLRRRVAAIERDGSPSSWPLRSPPLRDRHGPFPGRL